MEQTWKVPRGIPMMKIGESDLPGIGFGTFGSGLSAMSVAEAVRTALKKGYRFLDCAAAYGNEREVGSVIDQAIVDGLPRRELFILSKLWNEDHGNVAGAFEQTLAHLKLDYLDAYLIHWPVPNGLSPEASKEIYNLSSKPYRHKEFMKTWRAMEALVDLGKVRYIGVSNMTIAKLQLLLRDARIRPAICEMECHPNFQQGELFQFCLDHDILPVAYSPLGAPRRPERNRRANDCVDMQDPAVMEAAKNHGVHPAAICIKWSSQRGMLPIPFSSNPDNIQANLEAVAMEPLSDAEMNAIRGADRNCRLSRGEAYLWPGARSYLDLWDVDENHAAQKLDI